MKVMVMVKATERSETGEMGSAEDFVAMDLYNEKLVEAGIVESGAGLQPSSKGKRIAFDAEGNTTMIDGPFSETKELVAGFVLTKAPSSEQSLIEAALDESLRATDILFKQDMTKAMHRLHSFKAEKV